MKKNTKRLRQNVIKGSIACFTILLLVTINTFTQKNMIPPSREVSVFSYDINSIPPYTGASYVPLNNNQPHFKEKQRTTTSFEYYSDLDNLSRCGVAFANIGEETMPTTKRESIGQIKPSGWQLSKYDIVSGKFLYNRCHLIGYQLTGENANPKNLITCTRYMNTVGMLEFENKVAAYIKKTKNHVLYRVTPIFEGENLLASGVQIEAQSVEDEGKGMSFNVFVYNVQEGIDIDYKTGQSKLHTAP